MYIGIDQVSEQRNDAREHVHYVKGRGEQLPVRDESMNEVVLRNVFGDPTIDAKVKEDMISEIIRVLKSEGILKIIEAITGEVAEEWKGRILEISAGSLSFESELSKLQAQNEPSADIDSTFITTGLSPAFIWIFCKRVILTGDQ